MTNARRVKAFVAALVICFLPQMACDSSGDRRPKRKAATQAARTEDERKNTKDECSENADCTDEDPCTVETCRQGKCIASNARAGTSCDDGNVCDGVATCDGNGRCVQGSPSQTDDGNACTLDACDSVRGVTHEPVAIDDADPCTNDSCDPRTGTISHDSVNVDDGDDCTVDSCDPGSGVKHEPRSSFYTCRASCGDGFHAVSRTPSKACGSPEALRLFCSADCGDSFYTCDSLCPPGYDRRAEPKGGQCGPDSPTMLYCVRT